jgi:hypothetical protein
MTFVNPARVISAGNYDFEARLKPDIFFNLAVPNCETMSRFLRTSHVDYTKIFDDYNTRNISHFQIRGKTFDISRMEIESCVLTLFLEGKYSMTDSTNLYI